MNHLWCPGLDTEMQNCAEQILYYWPNMSHPYTEAGLRELGSIPITDKLYILCHGHSEVPLFSTTKGNWTPAQIATFLENDGLKKQHRVIELLVCHAGESVTTLKTASARLEVFREMESAKADGKVTGIMPLTRHDDSFKNKINKKYEKIKGPKPAAFNSPDQCLPLAAQLIEQLKHKGYTNLVLISYAAPVAQCWSHKTKDVVLDLREREPKGKWDTPIKERMDLKKYWRTL